MYPGKEKGFDTDFTRKLSLSIRLKLVKKLFEKINKKNYIYIYIYIIKKKKRHKVSVKHGFKN